MPRLAADLDADLVIAATRGRSGWKRALLGSVTEQLVHGLEAPLLTMPPRDRYESGRRGVRPIEN